MNKIKFKAIIITIISILIIFGLNISKSDATYVPLASPGHFCIGRHLVYNSRVASWYRLYSGGNQVDTHLKDVNRNDASIKARRRLAYALYTSGNDSWGNRTRGTQYWIWNEIYSGNGKYWPGVPKNIIRGEYHSISSTQTGREVESFIANDVGATIKVTGSLSTENYKMGPFKASYNGRITEITVTDIDGNVIESKDLQIIQNDREITLNNYDSTIQKNYYNITENQDFYIINNSGREVDKIYFHVYMDHTYYVTKYDSWWEGIIQPVLHVTERKVPQHEILEADCTLDIEVKKGDIELRKLGNYSYIDENGKEVTVEEPLSGVTFKVYSNTYNKYVKDIVSETNASGKTRIEWTDKIDEAKEYVTGEDGVVKITNLLAGGNYSNPDENKYTYTLIEIKGDNEYYIDPLEMSGVSSNQSYFNQKMGTFTDENGKTYYAITDVKVLDKWSSGNGTVNYYIITVKNARTSGDLRINKVDSRHNEVKLEGAEFKVQLVKAQKYNIQNMWIKQADLTNGNYDYSKLHHDAYLVDESQSGTFVTDKNGRINIKGIINGTYHIYETKAAKGYDITKQEGYGKDLAHPTWVDYGEVEITTENNIVYDFVENDKILAKIEGHVWLDGIDTNKQGSQYDSLRFTYTDKVVDPGIRVYLKDENGVVINSTITDGTGYWHIDKKQDNTDINYWDLENAYIEFAYDNITYVCVDPFALGGTANVTDSNGNTVKSVVANSKAQEATLSQDELEDSKLTGTQGNLPGEAVTKQNATKGMDPNEIVNARWDNPNYNLEELGLTGYYNESNFTVENINLGLWEKLEPTHEVTETLEYSKILINGYTYTYDYAHGTNQIESSNVPATYRQEGSKYYSTSKIYPSDIAYTAKGNPNGMEMYVIYKIAVRNTTTYDEPFRNIYDELRLYLTQLNNNFNDNIYELSTQNSESGWDGANYFGLWKTTGAGKASYKVNDDGALVGKEDGVISDGINPGDTESIYIQFKVKQYYLETVLKGNIPEGLEVAVTKADSIGYHGYMRTDNVWDYNASVKFYENSRQIDQNETQAVKEAFLHKSTEKYSESGALCLLFQLGDPRVISGTVYEDTQTKESTDRNESLGNGIIDANETNRGSKVKVELLNATDGEPVAKLYKKDGNSETGYREENAETWSAEDGNYRFEGVVPGLYKIRFTYTDGTSKMLDANLTPRDYKSTIINTQEAGNYIKDAMETKVEDMRANVNIYNQNTSNKDLQKIVEWYKYLSNSNYNITTDNLEARNEFEKYNYNEVEQGTNVTSQDGTTIDQWPSMESYTPYFSISIENDIETSANVADAHKPNYTGFNFGLIKSTEIDINLDKIISNVKLTNQVGTVLDQGDPSKTRDYVTALDNLSKGSKYARAEMNMNDIYGSELETTYEITISNDSVKDYTEDVGTANYGYYFRYGQKTNDAYLKTATVLQVVDFIDGNYNLYEGTPEETVVHPKEAKGGERTDTDSNVTLRIVESEEQPRYLSLTDWSAIEAGGTIRVDYTVDGIFQEDMDLSYDNSAKIVSMKLASGATLKTAYDWGDYSTTTLVITPETGEDRSQTYYIVGAIALIILATGVVVIKKKILK